MEGESPAASQTRLAVYPLKSADPASVLKVLQRQFPHLEFVPDERARRLMVWAPESQQDQVRRLQPTGGWDRS